MTNRSVDLTEHQSRFIETLVASGRYQNVSEAVIAGLKLLEQQTTEEEEKLAKLRESAAEAFSSLDRGEGTRLEGDQQLEEFLSLIGQRAAQRTEQGAAVE